MASASAITISMRGGAGARGRAGNVTVKVKPPLMQKRKKKGVAVAAALGDVSSEGTVYLAAGAVAIALVGTAFPILFSRKDLCPECDGAGFVRKTGTTLRANAARKDLPQIVCPRCSGLGKLRQIDK